MVRDVAQAILKRLGLATVAAADGDEAAVRLFAAEPERFAVVLLDLTMPRLRGAETFRQIREIKPNAPVILTSRRRSDRVMVGRMDRRDATPMRPERSGAAFRRGQHQDRGEAARQHEEQQPPCIRSRGGAGVSDGIRCRQRCHRRAGLGEDASLRWGCAGLGEDAADRRR